MAVAGAGEAHYKPGLSPVLELRVMQRSSPRSNAVELPYAVMSASAVRGTKTYKPDGIAQTTIGLLALINQQRHDPDGQEGARRRCGGRAFTRGRPERPGGAT
jgi:hypothetical protein